MHEDSLIPLSYLSQYAYCPRRAGLLLLEQQWQENEYTAEGRAQHDRVHDMRIERRQEMVKLYEHTVFSQSLQLSGKCDCIEATPMSATASTAACTLPTLTGLYMLYPVEYKHGKVRKEQSYHLQLCAQAMCLEEQYGGSIEKGAIFYINDHRRVEVFFDAALRQTVQQTAKHLQQMLVCQAVPPATVTARCKKCSIQEICHPNWNCNAKSYLTNLWKCAKEDDICNDC